MQWDTKTHCLFPPLVFSLALSLLGAAAELAPLTSRPQRKESEGPFHQFLTLNPSPLLAQQRVLWVEMKVPSPNTLSVDGAMSPVYGHAGTSKVAICEASGNSEFMG